MSEHKHQPDAQLTALQGVLRQLDLAGAADSIALRVDQARDGAWPPEQFLARLLADELDRRAAVTSPRRLVIANDARAFQVDGRPAVSLVRRTALRRLLLAVLHHRRDGQAASVQDMVTAGWPREQLSESQGATRVYTAIRTLRRMGLENILTTTDRGYELAPEVDVICQPG